MDGNLSNQISQEVHTLYKTVRQIYDKSDQSQISPLNVFWADQLPDLLKIIHGDLDIVAKIHAVLETLYFSVNTPDEDIKIHVVDWYLRYFTKNNININEFGSFVQESSYANSLNSITVDGRLLSPDFLRSLVLMTEIHKTCELPKDKHFRILELGAGYGSLARTLKLIYPQTTYLIIDIPESLFFSEAFLRLNFPEAKVLHVSSISDLNTTLDKFDFIFIPTLFAEGLTGEQFELFCNTASLGEMKNSVIRYWMNFVQNQVKLRYFFGLNRYLNTINPYLHTYRLDENVCSVSFDVKWKILDWELEPPFTRCPYLETLVNRNLEIIAERLPEPGEKQNRERSLSLVSEVMKQDWFVYYNTNNTMQLRDNILVPDLTMSGTLFALWESIRQFPTAENVEIMIKYLTTLARNKPFEEVFYYQELLQQLSPETDTRALIKRFGTSTPGIKLIEAVGEYNLVQVGEQFMAVSWALGEVDLLQETLGTREIPGLLLIGQDLAELRQRLVQIHSGVL